MTLFDFESQNLVVDWISINIQDLTDPKLVASGLSNYFNPHVLINGKPELSYHDSKKKYKVFIHHYTEFKSYWVGTQVIFSGKNANYFYSLVKTQKFNWSTLRMN